MGSQVEVAFRYDALGRRIVKEAYSGGVATDAKTYYLYDGPRVIEEFDGATYVYGNYVDEVLQMQRDTDPGVAGMESHYYLQDDLFNVCAVTDATGAVVERYEYGEYGTPEIMDASPNAHCRSQEHWNASKYSTIER